MLTLRRSASPSGKHGEVVVSDSRGRVVHVTRGLAAMLGTTTEQLMSNSLPHAIEKVMAQPFAQIHRVLTQVCAVLSSEAACSINILTCTPAVRLWLCREIVSQHT